MLCRCHKDYGDRVQHHAAQARSAMDAMAAELAAATVGGIGGGGGGGGGGVEGFGASGSHGYGYSNIAAGAVAGMRAATVIEAHALDCKLGPPGGK